MNYDKHDLAGLKQIHTGKWQTFELAEDDTVQDRVTQVRNHVAELARVLKTDWIKTGERVFAIRFPTNSLIDGYPKALLDAIIAEADGISFCFDCGELAMVVAVESVLQLYDGKRI